MDIPVIHESISHLPTDVQVIVTHESLVDRAHNERPNITIVALPASDSFVNSPRYEEIVEALKKAATAPAGAPAAGIAIDGVGPVDFDESSIRLAQSFQTKEEAIKAAGQILVDMGCVTPEYIQGMIDRDKEFTVYIGNGVAIPHGTVDAKQYIKKSGLSLIQVPDGVDFDGELTKIIVGIAGENDKQMDILVKLVNVFEDEANVEKLVKAKTKKEMIDFINNA